MFIFYFCVQIFFFKLLILNGEPLSPRSVKTKYGVLRGVLRHYTKQSVNPDLSSSILELPNKFSVEIFRSVPFAQPPIANLRFLPPVTQSRWRGTKLANRFLSVCIQNTAEVASSDILPFETKDMNKNDDSFKKQDIYFQSLKKNTSDLLKLIRNKKNLNGSSLSFNNIKETKNSFNNPSYDQNYKNKIKKKNFEREYISNLLKTHSTYLLPFKPYIQNQDEDCLYLNLYVPYIQNNSNKEKFPVLVFVHGESFDWGSGNAYDGSFLAGIKNMIVVTLNYRLGVFGFMPSLIEGSVRTNHGILDVLASLHWIQDNIENFGGSTFNITLVGHQKGAALVQFLKKSSLSKGLFQRSILFSGSVLSNWALAEQPEFYTRALASKLDCITEKDSLTKEQINFNSAETHDLFHSKLSLNLNLSNHFTESDEQIFKCLRSRTTEQLKTASTRLTNSYFSPFYSLFGPTIDSFLIKSDFNSFKDLFLNTSSRENLISNSIKNDHNLLLGFSSNRPKLKLGLINFFETLSKLPESEGLYYLNFFMKDFFSFVNSLVKNKSINNLNYIDKLFLQNFSSTNKINLINNSSSWIFKKQDELSSIFYSLLLDVLTVVPTFNAANTHFYDSIYAFILSSEQKNNFEDEELSSLFGSSLAGYYFNVTDGLGRFRTNQTNLYQIKQTELMIASVYSFVKTGNPTILLNKKHRQENFTWPKYNLNSKKFLLLDNQWNIMSSNTKNSFLEKVSKLLELLETNENLNASTLFDLEKQLVDKLQTINNTSLKDKTILISSFLSKLIAHLDLKIKNYNQLIKQKSKENIKFSFKTVNSSQVNNIAIESTDSEKGYSNTLISETPINDSNDMKKKFEKSTSFTGNLIRNRENSFSSRIELKNQTNEHKKSLSNSFFSISNFDSGKKTLFYTNIMIAIFSAGLLMLLVNVFVLFLGYKCIQKRKISKQNETSKNKEINSKKNLNNLPSNSNDNQILDSNICLTPNTISYTKNIENNSEENQIKLNEKCFCDQTPFCNCTDFQEINLIKDESSYFADHMNNGQNCSPLSHLVARPICNLLTTDNFESESIKTSHEIDQVKTNLQSASSDNLAQIIALSSMNNKEFNFNSCNEQSKKQDLFNDNNLSNCDYKILNQTPMLAVLESSSNTNLLQGFNAIGCNSDLYNVFQSHNFCTTFNKNNSTSKSLMNSCFQEPMSNINVTLLNTNNITSTPVNTVNEPQIRAHCPQTIQLQLLTKNLDNDFQN